MSSSPNGAGSGGCCGGGAPGSGHHGPVSGMMAGTPTYVVPRVGGPDTLARPEHVRAVSHPRGCCGPVSGMLAGPAAHVVATRLLDARRVGPVVGFSPAAGWCSWRSFVEGFRLRRESEPICPTVPSPRALVPASAAPAGPSSRRVPITATVIPGEQTFSLRRYPLRDINRPKRLRRETAILIKAHYAGAAVMWDPTVEEAQILVNKVSELARANAYAEPESGFDLDVQLKSKSEVFWVVDMSPAPAPSPTFFANDLIDLIDEFFELYGIELHRTWDHAIVVVPPSVEGNSNALNLGRYAIFTEDLLPALGVDPIETWAPGILHEIGHGYAIAHAGTSRSEWAVQEEARLVEYGDAFDYMGGVGRLDFRYNAACFPDPPPVFDDSNTHLNPIHKWHHGWLPDSAIVKIPPQTGPTEYAIEGISVPSAGIRALQIERGIDPVFGFPISILVYWRDNEDNSKTGASIALVSKEQVGQKTSLIEFQKGPNQGPGCQIGPPPPVFPVWYATLTEGDSWTDDGPGGSGVVITCNGLGTAPTTGDPAMLVVVDNRAQEDRPFSGIPILDIISPLIESGAVITNADTITVEVKATNPEMDPNQLGWRDIKCAKASLSYAEDPRIPLNITISGVLQRAEFYFTMGTEVWEIVVADLSDSGSGDPLRKIITLLVEVETTSGQVNAGVRKFLLDQRSPTP